MKIILHEIFYKNYETRKANYKSQTKDINMFTAKMFVIHVFERNLFIPYNYAKTSHGTFMMSSCFSPKNSTFGMVHCTQ